MTAAARTVLMTADAVGGVYSYAFELARALRPARVVLAFMGPGPSPAQRAELAAASIEFRAGGHLLEWMAEPWDDVARAGEWLLRLRDELAPDVVHLNGYCHGALPFACPTVMVAHSCVLSWYRAVRAQEAPAQWDRYRREVARGLCAATVVVAPTRAMLRSLERDHGPFARCQVIANGRDAARFPPGPKEDLVLSAGRLWDDAKGLSSLLAAAPALRWPVEIAGSALAPRGTEAPAGDPSTDRPAPSVTLLGELPVEELARRMSRAAIYALPARYEPFGLSILEAALAGCCLVIGDLPSLRETWDGAAAFVPPGDTAALAAAINELAADPSTRSRLAAEARRRALLLTAAAMAARYAALYEELIVAAPSRGRRTAPAGPACA